MKASVIIPTNNAGSHIEKLLDLVAHQTLQEIDVLIIDSSSSDDTVEKARKFGIRIEVIPVSSFDHGATRQRAVELCATSERLVFFTQDALPYDIYSLERLVACLDDDSVGAAYGRQLPAPLATPFAAHARLFNYPPDSIVKSLTDSARLGIKTAFISNSFAAYRRSALISIGGFPDNVILSEDMYVTAKMLMNGYKIAYCADACVYHSHNYSPWQEFKRYFDQGVFHAQEAWIRSEFGHAEGEGKKFVQSELRYLIKEAPWLIPSALYRSMLKYIGYRLGQNECALPIQVKRCISMNKGYWN